MSHESKKSVGFVKELGDYVFSAFAFESLNHHIVKLPKGPARHEVQIAENFHLYKYLSNAYFNEKIKSAWVKNYITTSLNDFQCKSNDGDITLGPRMTNVDAERTEKLIELCFKHSETEQQDKESNQKQKKKKKKDELLFYRHLFYNNIKYSAQISDNWFDGAVSYENESGLNYGLISNIFVLKDHVFLEMRCLQKITSNFKNICQTDSFALNFTPTGTYELIQADKLKQRFVMYRKGQNLIFMDFPNKIEYT